MHPRIILPRTRGAFTLAALAVLLLATQNAFGEERLHLGPGESNWTPPDPARGQRAVIVTEDLSTITVNDLIAALFENIPAGVSVSNRSFTGVNRAGGRFSNGQAPIGIADGLIISSGNIASVSGGGAGQHNQSDSITTNNAQGGDADLNAIISPSETYDRALLQFDIRSDVDRILGFRYVFGTEEHNEYVETCYNDAVAVFIDSGTGYRNHAVLRNPDGSVDPVSVNTLNCDNPYAPPGGTHCDAYVNNDCDDGWGGHPCEPAHETELDGLSKVLIAEPLVMNANQTYHVKLVIADNSDRFWDADAFFKASAEAGACCIPPPAESSEWACVDGVSSAYCTNELGGTAFHQGELCTNLNPGCGVPIGMCCEPDGDCADAKTEDWCDAAGGVWGGKDSVCETEFAPCCLPEDHTCVMMTPTCCALHGGQPAPLSADNCDPVGACLWLEWPIHVSCSETSFECCVAAGCCNPPIFVWLGGVPCPPIGACCLTDGTCFETSDVECATYGFFQGDGTSCLGDVNPPDGVDDTCAAHSPVPLSVSSAPIKQVQITGDPSGWTDFAVTRSTGASVNVNAQASGSLGGIHYNFYRWIFNGVPMTEGDMNLAFTLTTPTELLATYTTDDLLCFTDCLLGPGHVSTTGMCAEFSFDFDGDDDVDLSDFKAVQMGEPFWSSHTLVVTSTPIPGIHITGTPSGYTVFTAQMAHNAHVTMTAGTRIHLADRTYDFERWFLNGVPMTDGQTTLSFTMNVPATAHANYIEKVSIIQVRSLADHDVGTYGFVITEETPIESRSTGIHHVEITFSAPMDKSTCENSSNVLISTGGTPEPVGMTLALDASGTVLTMRLASPLADVHCWDFDLTGMLSASLAPVSDPMFSIAALSGDLLRDGQVGTEDIVEFMTHEMHPVDESTFHADVNADGLINAADLSMIMANMNMAVSCP